MHAFKDDFRYRFRTVRIESLLHAFLSLFFPQVPFLPGAYGIDEFQEMLENKLYEEFKARPHWGKNNRLNQSKIEEIYHKDSLKKWGEVYKIFNKGGPFENRFTNNMGFTELFDHPIDEQPSA